MLIDWFTVSAQIVNFLVLIYLLKRFLYGPILQAMDRREQRIGDRLKEAEEKRSEAEKEAEEYWRRNRELEDERTQRIKEAEEEAEKRRKELINQAKSEAESVREAWKGTVRREQHAFIEELKRRAGSEVIRMARKSLTDLADADLDSRLADVFIKRIEALQGKEKENCARVAKDKGLFVRSSFELEPSLKQKITMALYSVCGTEPPVRYETDPEMALGIEMTFGGLRISWGVSSYFDSLEKNISDMLEQSAASSPESGKGAS